MSRAKSRIAPVDLVRLVSILAVFAVHLHSSAIVRLPDSPRARELWLDFARNGSYGVSLFFVVSGFVISRTILKRGADLGRVDFRAFYARRAGRILPLLVAVVLLGALALRLVSGASPRNDFCLRSPGARFDTTFWLSLFTFSFNWLRIAREPLSYGFGVHWDVLWSLAIEEQFYLGYPLLLRTLGTRARVAAALSGIILLGPLARLVAAFQVPASFLWGFTSSPAAFDLIAMGALLCFFVERFPRPSSHHAKLEIALGFVGAAGVIVTYVHSSLDQTWDRVWGPTAIGLSLVLFLAVAVRREWFETPVVSAFTAPGQWSYGGYLLHATTLFLLWRVLSGWQAIAAFAVFAIVTLALAAAVYRLLEVPANRAIRRRLAAV